MFFILFSQSHIQTQNVCNHPKKGYGFQEIGMVHAEDVVIAIAFKRYSSDTILAVEMAKDAGCKVIAMTDSYAAPIAPGAEKVIVNSIDSMSFFNSYASFIMNMETIVALVSKRNKELNQSRLMKMEDYLERTGQY